MEEWIENGVRLAWLIDTKTKQVHTYRPNSLAEVLNNPSKVSADDVLPGFELDVTEIW